MKVNPEKKNKDHHPRSADSGSTVASDGRTRKCLVTDVSWEEGCDSCVRYAFVCSLNLLIGSRVNSGASSLQLVIRTLLFSGFRWFDLRTAFEIRYGRPGPDLRASIQVILGSPGMIRQAMRCSSSQNPFSSTV